MQKWKRGNITKIFFCKGNWKDPAFQNDVLHLPNLHTYEGDHSQVNHTHLRGKKAQNPPGRGQTTQHGRDDRHGRIAASIHLHGAKLTHKYEVLAFSALLFSTEERAT